MRSLMLQRGIKIEQVCIVKDLKYFEEYFTKLALKSQYKKNRNDVNTMNFYSAYEQIHMV